jgi:glutamate N-acetyltransferase/amino-acid N-acetyltransferase
MNISYEKGGVCAASGFKAGGIHCGFRHNVSKKDLAMIVSDEMCSAAAVYTTNKIKGAPIAVTREHLASGTARAIICNSGNANTCAPNGVQIATETCRLTAAAIGGSESDIIVASTGVIGMEMTIDPFVHGIPKLAAALSYDGGSEAAGAILTTDTHKKEVAVSFLLGGTKCTLGGMAKGSGMIHPNMATMLSFLTSDVDISPDMLQQALSANVVDTFNQLSVDGDTSTNDMVVILANGMAGNKKITSDGDDFQAFCQALYQVTTALVEKIAADGEGASKLIVCSVKNAETREDARKISMSVISSDLLKTAVFGKDANWGRVLCAIGYTDGDFDVSNVTIELGSENGRIRVCHGSEYVPYSEDEATDILSGGKVDINVDMHAGKAQARAWGCDLTYDYVKINSDYRS